MHYLRETRSIILSLELLATAVLTHVPQLIWIDLIITIKCITETSANRAEVTKDQTPSTLGAKLYGHPL